MSAIIKGIKPNRSVQLRHRPGLICTYRLLFERPAPCFGLCSSCVLAPRTCRPNPTDVLRQPDEAEPFDGAQPDEAHLDGVQPMKHMFIFRRHCAPTWRKA